MKLPELEKLSPLERRRFLKALGTVLGMSTLSPTLQMDALELAGGKAFAQAAADDTKTYFIEINYRDQWDMGHVFVAPGLATASNLRRGGTGRRCAVYAQQPELQLRTVNGKAVYLTNDSIALDPHLDTIAMVDNCELSTGAIHGHEAANPLRSPGRTYTRKAGYGAMFQNDMPSNFPQGCEEFYTATPTPATLHNYHQKSLTPGLHNGIAFKGISRDIHTVYHYGAGLAGSELDRKQSVRALTQAFPDKIEDANILAKPEQAEAFKRMLARLDLKRLEAQNYTDSARATHERTLDDSKKLLYVGTPKLVSLPLSAEERTFWSAGVPNQVAGGPVKANIWEQAAYASKIVTNDLARSVALEFDYVDVHDSRPEAQVRVMGQQTSLPLARLIQSLKAANIYDRTLIAIYTTDGSRSPAANSTGSEGKNTIILAGGMIRGGYYGDITVAGDDGDGHRYGYRVPDNDTGVPGTARTDNAGRVTGAAVYRTVMKALRVPDALAGSFPDTAAARPLSYLLR